MIERAVRQEEAQAELLAVRVEQRRASLRLARLFAKIDASYHWIYESCSSLGAYGERMGFSAREARTLVEVGKALDADPRLEERILEGRISLDAAAVLGRFHENAEELARDGEDWIDYAEKWTARKLERELKKRMRESETGGPVSVMTAILTSEGREKFERARQIACRKEQRVLEEGEAVEVITDHYLDSFDPDRKKPRKRRMPDTTGRPGRNVAAEVKREVVAREGDECPNPECDHRIFMNLCHDDPHRNGGNREADNLDWLCRSCHLLVDRGLLIVKRTPDGLEFRRPDGSLIGRTRAPPG
jgi:hypothetical protein